MLLPNVRGLLTHTIALVATWGACLSTLAAEPVVDCDFPGGNIVVERTEGRMTTTATIWARASTRRLPPCERLCLPGPMGDCGSR